MGLNFVRRGPREEFDSPNDFITVALGKIDSNMANHDEELILEYQKKVLLGIKDRVDDIYFDRD